MQGWRRQFCEHKRGRHNFQEMFVCASSVDQGLYQVIILRVSELDSPVVQPLGLARKRWIQQISASARDTEHKLDHCSLERSFACPTISTVKPDSITFRQCENWISRECSIEEYCCRVPRKNYTRPLAKMMPSTLSQLFTQGSIEIVINLDIQARDVLHLPAFPMTLVVWETSIQS